MNNLDFKQKIYDACMEVLNRKASSCKNALHELTIGIENDTKSSAGDKHETALAMLQIEQANTRGQLKEVLEQKAAYEKINPLLSAAIIVNGSLIKTNRGYLFLSTALGKALIEGVTVTALSAQSPLGAKLLGLAVADTAEVNNNRFVIESIE